MSQHENTPQFIKQIPWYASKQGNIGSSSSSKAAKAQLQQWYDRGAKGYQATTFRKGACENCGAMGHNRKQCTERPRKLGARFSTKNIAPDDITKNLQLNWEGKRDRWNGFDSNMYKEVIHEYEQHEQIRKLAKHEQGEQDVDKEYKHSVDAIELASLPSKHAKNQKYQGLGGVRNKDDIAKYLLNLDENSDHFDPKSRSMKSYDRQFNNLQTIGQKDQLLNQERFAAEQVQLHNSELSSVALPTLTQKIYKKIKQNNLNSATSSRAKELYQKYGEIDNLMNLSKPIDVIEQDEDEEVKINKYKNRIDRPVNRSKYQQDVLINDHTTVWGSWYNKLLGWGYECCHATEKISYCLGNRGKQRALAAQLKAKAQKLRELKQLEEAVKINDPNQQKNQEEVYNNDKQEVHGNQHQKAQQKQQNGEQEQKQQQQQQQKQNDK